MLAHRVHQLCSFLGNGLLTTAVLVILTLTVHSRKRTKVYLLLSCSRN